MTTANAKSTGKTTTTAKTASGKARTVRTGKTPEQRRAEADALQALIVEQVQILQTSEGWLSFLAASRTLHRYSLNNVLSAVSQRPEGISLLGGYRWPSAGTAWPTSPCSARSPPCSARLLRTRRSADWSTGSPRTPSGRSPIRRARAKARQVSWAHRCPVPRSQVIVDIDALLVTAHSETAHSEKELASATYKRGFGFHPLLAFADHTPGRDGQRTGGGGEALAAVLRTGRAGGFRPRLHPQLQ